MLIKGAKGLVTRNVASFNYVYTMSCFDQANMFKGKDETNVQNGYGLKVTSLYVNMY